jgi:hypothetical protein
LPPIIYPAAPVNISEGKVVGALKTMPGPLDGSGDEGSDSSGTDSSEDREGEDAHKLHQIAQAIRQANRSLL